MPLKHLCGRGWWYCSPAPGTAHGGREGGTELQWFDVQPPHLMGVWS